MKPCDLVSKEQFDAAYARIVKEASTLHGGKGTIREFKEKLTAALEDLLGMEPSFVSGDLDWLLTKGTKRPPVVELAEPIGRVHQLSDDGDDMTAEERREWIDSLQWLPWRGGDRPVSVDVEVIAQTADGRVGEPCAAKDVHWGYKGIPLGARVVAFKVLYKYDRQDKKVNPFTSTTTARKTV